MSQPEPDQNPPAASADATSDKGQSGKGWKIATGVLAVVAVVALIWGVTSNNDKQSQIDALNATVAGQAKTGETAATVAEAQIKALEVQSAALDKALKELAEQSSEVLDAVSDQYQALETQLKKTQEAIATLQQDKANTEATAAEIASAYDTAEQELEATQEALAELLTAISEQLAAQK